MRAVINDIRWQALKTVGEKRQAFSEWVNKATKREEEEERKHQLIAMNKYRELLRNTPEITIKSIWADIRPILEHNEWYIDY